MGTNTLPMFCKNCPRNHYGVCSGIVKVLTKSNEFHLPQLITVPAKKYLYHQYEKPVKTYILRRGWMLLTQLSARGKRQVIRSVLPGDILGFQTDIEKPFAYSAIAIEDSVVCAVPDLFNMCSQYPELSLKLLWEEQRERDLAEHYMANIAHRNAREKVAFMALELYHRLELRGLNNGYIIPFPLKQEDIADTLGLTVIHVNRTLHQLQEDKVLSIHKHELSILDYEKLVALVNQDLIKSDTCGLPSVNRLLDQNDQQISFLWR